jgi:sugar transferase (PEP-CTERM/EpsH1 system associated)
MPASLAVSHVVLSLDCGGLEHVVLHLLQEGRQAGQRVSVICLERPGDLALEAEGITGSVHCVEKGPGLRLGTIRRLRSLFREIRPDIVHTHQIGALFYAGLAARGAGVPLVVHTEHGKHYASRRRTRWLGWFAGLYAAQFFCVSEDIAAEVRACRVVPDRKLSVVPNGINTDRFRDRSGAQSLRRSLGIPLEAPVLGSLGRLTEVKRQDLLLDAFSQVRRRVPDAHLLLVGDGPLMGDLRRHSCRLGLEEVIHFAGYQPEPARYLAAMDVFALSSRSEGMPLVVLEAWASSVPVVATAVGGLPDLIDPGRTGELVPPGDPTALAEAVARLLEDPQLRSELGEGGYRKVTAHYEVRHMARTYEGHYLRLLGSEGRHASCAS